MLLVTNRLIGTLQTKQIVVLTWPIVLACLTSSPVCFTDYFRPPQSCANMGCFKPYLVHFANHQGFQDKPEASFSNPLQLCLTVTFHFAMPMVHVHRGCLQNFADSHLLIGHSPFHRFQKSAASANLKY